MERVVENRLIINCACQNPDHLMEKMVEYLKKRVQNEVDKCLNT